MLAATINTLTPRLRFKFYKPKIENFAFQLHYKATVTILMAFVILVCAREYFGDHIKCISDAGVDDKVIQTYCFFMATFTIVRHYNESLLQSGFLPHPGVGPMTESDETLFHTYYQWVPFVLFIQSICFYMPHYIWKKKEGGRIKALVTGLNYAGLALHDEDMKISKDLVVPSKKSLDERLNIIRNDIILRLQITRTWSVWLVSMEVANLLHIMFQIWLTNRFLNGHFIGLGPWLLSVSSWDNIVDPLETIFPKVTKCIFHKYGPSGSIQQHDALCVMALNIIHEKIYAVLWFWFLFLFIVSLIAVIWRIVSFFLYRRYTRFSQLMFRQVSGNKFNTYDMIRVINGCQYGDWLFLYYLAKNMEGFVFQALFVRLVEELQKQDTPYDTFERDKGAQDVQVVHNNGMHIDDETHPLRSDPDIQFRDTGARSDDTLPYRDAPTLLIGADTFPYRDAATLPMREDTLPYRDAATLPMRDDTLPYRDAATLPMRDDTLPFTSAATLPLRDDALFPLRDTSTHPMVAPAHPMRDAPAHPMRDAPAHPMRDAPAHPMRDAPTHPPIDVSTLLFRDASTLPLRDDATPPYTAASSVPPRDDKKGA